MRFVANQKVLHYRIIDPIGAGGMGEVYRAAHESLGRVVALKILTPTESCTDFASYFFNEAKIHARLQHPNIATLYDFFEYEGLLCIAMEFIGGRGLDEIIGESQRLPLDEALRIFQDIVSAISYVHESSIQHRDIKPGNIRIDQRGVAKLLDFGIAHDIDKHSMSRPDRLLGTLQYMAPEQLLGKKSDHRVDIWALGVLFYEMLMGRLPFEKETVAEYLDEVKNSKHLEEVIQLASLPENVKAIISRCLQRTPGRRYQNIRDLERDVVQLQYFQVRQPREGGAYKDNTFKKLRLNQIKKIATLASFGIVATSLTLYVLSNYYGQDDIVLPKSDASSVTLEPFRTDESSEIETQIHVLFRISIAGNYPVADVYRGNKKIGVTPFEDLAPVGTQVSYTLKHPDYKEKTVEFVVDPIERRNNILVELTRLQDEQ